MKKAGMIAAVVLLLLFVFAIPASATTNNTAEDNFIRANSSNTWVTTSNNDWLTNYAWQRSLGSSPYVSISSDQGIIVYTGTNGHKVAGYVNVPSNAGGDILEKFAFTHIGEAVAGGCLNVHGGTDWYQVDANTDLGTLEIRKRASGIMTTESSTTMSYSASTAYWLREDVQISSGVATVEARLWQDGTTEPTSWQVSWSDSSPLASGQAGAMGDWFKAPPSGTQIQFSNWAYAASGLASPAT
jgi:hypothetical protein